MALQNPYNNGKIYRIWSLNTNEIYVGSTYQELHKRMYEHRINAQTGKPYMVYHKMRELGIETFSIELIEVFPCKNRDELRQREGYWVRNLKATLNSVIPGRTLKEYNSENKEKLRQTKQQFYEDNKDRIKERVKEYQANNRIAVNEQKREYYEKNKERFKMYRETNIEKIKIRESQHNDCEICGGKYRTSHRAVHYRTRKHLLALEQ